MKLELNGKTAFIAGSSDGIGRAVAEGLASEGCDIILCARREHKLREVRDFIQSEHRVNVEFIIGNLDSGQEIDRIITETKKYHTNVDILVTNNGGPPPGNFIDISEESWNLAWNRTLMSTVRLIRGFLPGMIDSQWGRIINLTSIAVKQPIPRLLLSNSYRASIIGMAKTLSDEIASEGITVNNIAPGFILTSRTDHLFEDRARQSGRTLLEEKAIILDSIPARKMGKPEDIANLAVFLASPRANYITGTTIQVDGGLFRGLM